MASTILLSCTKIYGTAGAVKGIEPYRPVMACFALNIRGEPPAFYDISAMARHCMIGGFPPDLRCPEGNHQPSVGGQLVLKVTG